MNRRQPYCPQTPPFLADPLRGNPCDSRDPRRCVPPLKGLRETLTASVSYRASVPAGHAYCEVAPSHRALAPAADRQNRSFKALSGKGSAPATPPPFRHTPGQSRPRNTATVWRNLGRHPHRDGTYTFSAKEKDSETGLSYFGSRYYSSNLSIWLSVDPMSDKYAYQSGYVYCGNNPLTLIDPNGEDEWEVNKSGHIRHVEGSDGKPDKLFVVRGFGAKNFKKRTKVEGLDVDADLMKSMVDADEKYGKICISQTNRSEDMESLFNFLADNTNVEWSLATLDYGTGYGPTPERTDFLITDHARTRSETATKLTLNNCTNGGLIRIKHSHPAFLSLLDFLEHNRISTPSGNPQGSDYKGDYGHKRLCTESENSPNAIFILRYRGHDKIY